MAISFVASNEGNSDTDATSYSIAPIPSGSTTGDVCVVIVACPTATTGSVTFTGWTNLYTGNDTSAHRASVWYRVIQAGDTSATAFTFDPPGTPEGISWVSSSYRGADPTTPFIAQNGAFSAADADKILASPTVNNTESTAWRLSAAASSETVTGVATESWTASTGTERNDVDGAETTSHHSAAFYDSNGTIATGNTSVTHTLNSTSTTGDLVSWVGILKARPKTQTLVDPFTSFNSAVPPWNFSYGSPTLVSGQINLPCISSYSGLYSGTTYDLSDSYLLAELASIPTGGGNSRHTSMVSEIDSNNRIELGFIGDQLYFRQIVSGTITTWENMAYNSTNHRWWKIQHVTGTGVQAYVSPNGNDWTAFGSAHTTTLDVTSMFVTIFCGYFGTESSPPAALVDNVNNPPVATNAPAGTTTPSVTANSSVVRHGNLAGTATAVSVTANNPSVSAGSNTTANAGTATVSVTTNAVSKTYMPRNASVSTVTNNASISVGSSAPQTLFGVYKGYGSLAVPLMDDHETLVGREIEIATDYLPHDSWSQFNATTMRTWQLDPWRDWRDTRPNAKFVYGIPVLTDSNVGDFAGVVAGTYDSYFTIAGNALIDSGHPDAIIMLGWEPNNPGIGSWQATGNPTGYINAFQHIVTLLRGLSGNEFTFSLASAGGPSGLCTTFDSYYPGDAYVDYVGLNIYDVKWQDTSVTHAQRWTYNKTRDMGIDDHVAFAASHNKPLVCHEWGLYAPGDDYAGGGDDPYFITQMAAYFSDENVVFQSYFDFDWGGGNLADFPNGQTEYVNQFQNPPEPGYASTSVVADNPLVRIRPLPSTVTGSVTANDAVHRGLAQTVSPSVTVNSPTVGATSNASAQTTTQSVLANNPSIRKVDGAGTTTQSVTTNAATINLVDGIGTTTQSVVVNSATVTTHKDAAAPSVSGTVLANDATVAGDSTINAGTTSGQVETFNAVVTASAQVNAGVNTATTLANDASVATHVDVSAGTSTISVLAQDSTVDNHVGATAQTVTASVVSDDPTVTASGSTNAGRADVSTLAFNTTASTFSNITAPAQTTTQSVQSFDATVSFAVTINAQTTTQSITAENATALLSSNAPSGTSTSNVETFDASVTLQANAPAGTTTASVLAEDPSLENDTDVLPSDTTQVVNAENASVRIGLFTPAGTTSGTGEAFDAMVDSQSAGTPGLAMVDVDTQGASAVTSFGVGDTSGTAQAFGASVSNSIQVQAGSASASVQSNDLGAQDRDIAAEDTSSSVAAFGATVGVGFSVGSADASVEVYDAGITSSAAVTVDVVVVSVTANDPSIANELDAEAGTTSASVVTNDAAVALKTVPINAVVNVSTLDIESTSGRIFIDLAELLDSKWSATLRGGSWSAALNTTDQWLSRLEEN